MNFVNDSLKIIYCKFSNLALEMSAVLIASKGLNSPWLKDGIEHGTAYSDG